MPTRVLLIDDQEDIRELATVVLEMDGEFSVMTAAGGEEGIAAAKSSAPDLILLDVMMPEMSGTEVFAHLRADSSTQKIPVVFLTGRADRDSKALLESGAAGVIAKPFNPSSLAAELSRIASQRLAR